MNHIIEIDRLDFGYKKGELTLKDLSINVPEGSIYGFIGPNGAGKSTTMRLISGIQPVNKDTESQIKVFGNPVAEQGYGVFKKIGALVESPTLYHHLSGEDNLKYIATVRGLSFEKIDPILELVDLLHAKKQRVKRYSLGMKQRLAIAMCLIHEPRLLLLDEPVNGLDPTGMIEIRKLLMRINQENGVTVFVSSHLLSEIERMCTHVGIIANGEIKFEGLVQDLEKLQTSCRAEITYEFEGDIRKVLEQSGIQAHHSSNQKMIIEVDEKSEIPGLIASLVKARVRLFEVVTNDDLESRFINMTKS